MYIYREGNKLIFLSEWCEFPSAPCLAGKKKPWWQLASRCCWNSARPWHASELVSFLVGLRTFQHPGKSRLQHTWTWLAAAWQSRQMCYRPAVFFPHLGLGCMYLFHCVILPTLWFASHVNKTLYQDHLNDWNYLFVFIFTKTRRHVKRNNTAG